MNKAPIAAVREERPHNKSKNDSGRNANTSLDKTAIRKTLLAQRSQAHKAETRAQTEEIGVGTAEATKAATEAAGAGLLGPMITWLQSRIAPGQILGTYSPIRTERDPEPVHAATLAPLAFPRVMGPDQPLCFFAVQGPNDFELGSFGVREPRATLPQVIPDVMLVPLVGFDRAGFRLGYGGGFYDRTLAKFQAIKPVLAVGFAYDGQLSHQPLNFEETDMALDALMTPTRVYEFCNGTARETLWH